MIDNCKVIEQQEVLVPDCFVKYNKLVTEANKRKAKPSSGESRIYFGSRSHSDFFTNRTETVLHQKKPFNLLAGKAYFLKRDLQEYMLYAKTEYTSPAQDYFYDISSSYHQNIKLLDEFPDKIEFDVFDHKGDKDKDRFYLNSKHAIWDVFRTIALPKISNVVIYKLVNDNGGISYYFKPILSPKYYMEKDVSELIEQVTSPQTPIDFETLVDAITSKEAQRKIRIGQTDFKSRLCMTMSKCPFTGITEKYLLIASHVKPWSESDSEERLDGYNGLLFTPTFDKLFDKGLISFEDDGRLLIAPSLPTSVIHCLNLNSQQVYDICNSHGKRSKYLKYHRDNIFKSEL